MQTDWIKTYENLLEDITVDYEAVRKYVYAYMPPKLYRYRAFDKFYQSNIIKGEVYFSFPDAYNDPFDCAIRVDFSKWSKSIFNKKQHKYFQKIQKRTPGFNMMIENTNQELFNRFKKYVKVACFSETYDSMLMWSHYAKNHTGFCIEYDTTKSKLFEELALPVIYKNERYDATNCMITRSPNIACNAVLYKSTDWSYEKEWRMFETVEYFKNKPECLNLKNAISAIYLGACTKESDNDKICEVKKWAKGSNIKIYKMSLDSASYNLCVKAEKI